MPLLQLEPVPLLQIQRDLYDLPRSFERFEAYIATMVGGSDDIALPPLVAMNPMGKPHVAALLDALLSIDAEGIAARSLVEAQRRLRGLEAKLKVGLVVADDAMGGWTDRHMFEAKHRFEWDADARRGWSTVMLWSSEVPSAETVVAETLSSVYRTLYLLRFGPPTTLHRMLRQEGLAAAFAGAEPTLAGDDLELVRLELEPHLEAGGFAQVFPLLYGDEAAAQAGLPTRGLPPRAGFELGLTQVLAAAAGPEDALLAAEVREDGKIVS